MFTKASIIATSEEATILFNEQQGDELYIKYVLQDATYFLLLFLEWVAPTQRASIALCQEDSSRNEMLMAINYYIKNTKKKKRKKVT